MDFNFILGVAHNLPVADQAFRFNSSGTKGAVRDFHYNP